MRLCINCNQRYDARKIISHVYPILGKKFYMCHSCYLKILKQKIEVK